MTTWIAGVDSVTKRFPTAVEDALATNVVAPAVSDYSAPKTGTYLPAPTGADDTAAIQAVANTVPSGGSLIVGDRYRMDGQLNITTPMTLYFTARGEFYSAAGTTVKTMINVTSSGVHLRGEGKITGPQFAAAANQTCVNFLGTSGSAPLTDVSVKGLTITKSGKYGILATYVKGFAFDNNVVKDCCYAGIGVLSAVNGSINNNTVQNITQTGYTQSYGIYTSRGSVALTAADPRSENISICNNRVQDIPLWDGINTHAGKTHTISGNVIVNVMKPIELVACPTTGSGGVETIAPLDMTVTGNVITSTVTDGSSGAAITLVGADGVGAGGGVGNPAEYATGTITGNMIRGHGAQSSSISGAILLYYTKGAVVSGNTVVEPSPIGINWYHTNSGFVCTGNTIVDPWTTASATCSAINLVSTNNTGHIADNILRLNGKSATLVAHRGISITSDATNTVTLGVNDMAAATTPVRDTGPRALPLGTLAPDTLANRPAASSAYAGMTFLATDQNGGMLYQCLAAAGGTFSWKQLGGAVNATVNDTDANLKNRANHMGTQAISTVTGLQAALDAAVAAGTPGAWVPADNGLLACDVDPLLCGSTLTLASAGVVYLRKMKMAVTSVITNVNLVVSGAGAGLSNAYVAVFNSAGTQLGVSADVSTTLQSTGAKVIPLSSPTASQSAGVWVYVAILVGGATTLPTVRAYATTGHNFGMTSAYRWGTSGTGQTSMPSSITVAGIASAAGAAPLVGLT